MIEWIDSRFFIIPRKGNAMQDKVHVHILHYYAERMYDVNTILMAVGYSPVVHRVQKTKSGNLKFAKPCAINGVHQILDVKL
ncbi:hypothetical protein HRE53_12105 [Acaryochloris sp. 'Moss Beach']|uniref:hypothetical protein n=1 Tax=Acaryochloris sp. 'Moss Beach' TaxID=2740837 RepID=UPI001F21734E|nr:hypothetical protein [Acaryochloris sp. 'Moss Beach']UJB72220.1 hypothetical protein HRE53_12105 [Acaryochloris sp. 'Moss Beach']